MNEYITVTRDLIDSMTSSKGGYTSDFFDLLGIDMQSRKIAGWKDRVCGNKILKSDYDRFIGLNLKEPKKVRRRYMPAQGELF